jgi:hypothetical protein
MSGGSSRMAEPELPAHNVLVDCKELHAELLDLETGTVWQSHRPISREAYQAIDLPAKLIKVGIGAGVMDEHYFRRSPGAEADGPVAEREIAGHLFIHCANPPKGGPETPVGDGPKLLRVDKHHSPIFEAGREVLVLRHADGRDFVQVVTASPGGGGLLQKAEVGTGPSEIQLPEGWLLRTETLAQRTTIHLPNPTEAWFFSNGSSFQGPVDTFGVPVASRSLRTVT